MKRPFDRVIIIVLDGVGAGALPDADQYGDAGSHTLLHIQQAVGLELPHLGSLGLSQIIPLTTEWKKGAWGRMAERSAGKDTTTGHWEIAGLILERPFPTYPEGFPPEIIKPFCEAIGRDILYNRPASGTEIIKRLGDEHVATGKPIVYTSADSVFQIAAHEEVIPLEELYRYCRIARQLLCGKHAVGRVIARPFIGSQGNYTRTRHRRDFSLLPPEPTLLDHLQKEGLVTIGVGKIGDIFAQQGLTQSLPLKGNPACIQGTLEQLRRPQPGLIFVNLVDFDMLYGHRNDPAGFKGALQDFDLVLPDIYAALTPQDLLIITADHGLDPTTPSTDHSREYVPLLCYHHQIGKVELGVRTTFADVASTIDENFGLHKICHGTSFLGQLL